MPAITVADITVLPRVVADPLSSARRVKYTTLNHRVSRIAL
jgi:hypothetical protein